MAFIFIFYLNYHKGTKRIYSKISIVDLHDPYKNKNILRFILTADKYFDLSGLKHSLNPKWVNLFSEGRIIWEKK